MICVLLPVLTPPPMAIQRAQDVHVSGAGPLLGKWKQMLANVRSDQKIQKIDHVTSLTNKSITVDHHYLSCLTHPLSDWKMNVRTCCFSYISYLAIHWHDHRRPPPPQPQPTECVSLVAWVEMYWRAAVIVEAHGILVLVKNFWRIRCDEVMITYWHKFICWTQKTKIHQSNMTYVPRKAVAEVSQLSCQPIYRLLDCLTTWQLNYLTTWLFDYLINCLTGWLTERRTGWLIQEQTNKPTNQQTNQPTNERINELTQ